ncbi:MAG: acyl carrier protein [Oscillospiraceae bacterium]|jgi:D-alanine--poly(phosphoribitol) ligase subunit 2|nr:acyl carrier protein [Oscillospiraceae bacterium]
MNEIEKKLFDYITETFEIDADDPDFGMDVDLFETGFLDSLGSFSIINFIEETWGVEITQKDLTLYPMNSIQEIAQVVGQKL